jgi:hypothetical protein
LRIVTVSASRDRDARRTRDLLHKLGVPFSTETIAATARVRHGDRVMEWTGYQPHLIRRYCPLGGL